MKRWELEVRRDLLRTNLRNQLRAAINARTDLPLRQRRQMIREYTAGDFLRHAINAYRAKSEEPPIDDDDSDTPILDWISENWEQIANFLRFLVEEFLPALIQIILVLIAGIPV